MLRVQQRNEKENVDAAEEGHNEIQNLISRKGGSSEIIREVELDNAYL